MQSFILTSTLLASLASLSSTQSIDPNSVPLATRDQWCSSQTAQCPLICTQTNAGSAATDSNSCDPTTLDYSCVCGNGLTPNVSEYSLTIPYYICTQNNNNCVAGCGGDSSCQSACRQDHPCGAQSPVKVNTTTTTTTSSSTATGTGAASSSSNVVYTGFGSSSSASPTAAANTHSSSATRHMLAAGETYGLGLIMMGIFAGFGFLL